jgi:thymidine kinase
MIKNSPEEKKAGNNKGRLEVICGSMFSGKTEELMRRLRQAEYARQVVLTIKHKIDDRNGFSYIASHDGRERLAFPVQNTLSSLEKILELANDDVDVVGIDEIQFFPKEIIPVLCTLVERGKRVIVAGLDLDFRGEPFGVVPLLLTIADTILKLKAICVLCSKEAYQSQRMINGKPADYDDPIILVGAEEMYEARCRDCFEINRKPAHAQRMAMGAVKAKKESQKTIV